MQSHTHTHTHEWILDIFLMHYRGTFVACMHPRIRAIYVCVCVLCYTGKEKAKELAQEKGFKLGIAKTSFKANSKVQCSATQLLCIFVESLLCTLHTMNMARKSAKACHQLRPWLSPELSSLCAGV